MDSFSSPGGQRSLISDTSLQDMSISLRNSTQNSSSMYNKPPIPSRQQQQSNSSQWSQQQQNENDDFANATTMSSWIDDDMDQDKENANNTPSKLSYKHRGTFSQSRQNLAAGELTNVTSSLFNDNSYMMSLLPTDDENLMNESANLLQNSYIENTATKRQPLKTNTSLNNTLGESGENSITTAQDRIKYMMMMSQKRESNLKRSFTIGYGDASFNNRSDTSQLFGNNTFTDKNRFNTSAGNESISTMSKRIDFNETAPIPSKNPSNTSTSSQSGLSSNQEILAQQTSSGNRLASMYFRPSDNSRLDTSGSTIPPANILHNPFDADASVSGMNQAPSFYNASLVNIDASQFVSGNEYLDELDKDEQLNRKEFADNELTVMMNYKSANTSAVAATPNSGSSSRNGSVSNNNQTWISNATHLQQNSQLEISTNSSMNNEAPYCAKAALDNHKKSVPVASYFQSSSDLPDWVVNARTPDPGMTSDDEMSSSNSSSGNSRESGSEYKQNHDQPQNDQGDKTICQEAENETKSKNDTDDITFSTPGSGRLADSASFSFTFNTSDSGSFLKKKTKDNSIDEQPTRDTQKDSFRPIRANGKTGDKLVCETNLKSIEEELNRVASRINDHQRIGINSSMSSNLSEPLMSSSVIKQNSQGISSTGSTASSNNKENGLSSHLIMDETMSSIRSSDISSDMYKANSRLMNRHHYSQKENLSTNTSGMSSILSASKKTTTGSLTSTPSKMIKSKSESSNMETINDDETIKRSSKKSSSGKQVASSSKMSSPSSRLDAIDEKPSVNSNISSNQQMPNPSIRPLKMPSPVQHSINEFIDNKSNRASISSTSSTSSTVVTPILSSSSSSDITSSALSKLSSLINNNHGTDLVPVVFFPLSSLVQSSGSSTSLPHHQHSRNSDQHSIKSMASNKSNFHDPNNISTGSDSNFISASESHQSNNLTMVSNLNGNHVSLPVDVSTLTANMPQIELSKAEIDFGCIAEGCSTMTRLNMNLNGKYNAVGSCYIQVELEDVKEWQIEPINDQGQVTSTKSFIFKKMEESLVKHLLGQPLGLTGGNTQSRRVSDMEPHDSQASLTDSTSSKSTASQIQLDLYSRYHSFYVHLDLSKVNIYKSLMEDIKRRAETKEELNTWLEPLRVRATLNIYFCVDLNNTRSSIGDVSSASFKSASSNMMMSSQVKKMALKQTSVMFTLGYAKLKSGLLSTGIAELEILIDSNRRLKFQQQQESDKTLNDEDHEKTLVQTNEAAQSHKRMLDRKYFPLINSGNINVSVACYLLKIGDSATSSSRIKSLSQSICLDSKTYEVHLASDHVMELMASAKIKSYLKLMLENADTVDPGPSDIVGNKRQPANSKLVIQVMPNGVKFETPIYITYRTEHSLSVPNHHSVASSVIHPPSTSSQAPMASKPTSKPSSRPKLFATKSVLFFGRALCDTTKYYDEFNLNVSDDASFNCMLTIQDDRNLCGDEQSGYFKLVNENDQEVDSLRVILTQQPLRVRVKFVDTSSNNKPFGLSDMIKIAKLKVKTLTEPSTQSNIKLVAFVGFHANVTIQNALSVNSLQIDRLRHSNPTKLEELLRAKQIRHHKHSIELGKTYNLNKSVNLYRKVLKLAHSGHKYILLPFVYNLRSNQDIGVNVGKIPLTASYVSTTNLEYDLSSRNRFTITIDTGLRVNFDEDEEEETSQATRRRVPWLELKPNEGSNETKLVLSLQSSDYTALDDICLVLFWIESDVMSYLCRTAQANMETLRSSLNESKSHDKINIVDTLYHKLIRVKRLATESHQFEDKRLSSASSISSLDSDMSRLNTTTNKTLKVINEELVRLFRQAIKCHLVKLTLDSMSTPSTHSVNRFDEDSLEIANANNTTSNSSSFSSTILSKPSHVEHIIDNSVSMDHSGHLGNSTRHQISQFTIDSLCLTPHVNANIVQTPSTHSSHQEPTHIIPVDLGIGGVKGVSSPLYEIKFPAISAKSQWTVELQLTNPARTAVVWRGYSTGPALMTTADDMSKKFTMNKPVFKMTPGSGSIGPFRSEMIKIEFKPADEISNALFSQNWHIDTRSNEPTSWFSSKLNLVGKTTQATPTTQTLRPSRGSESKLDYMYAPSTSSMSSTGTIPGSKTSSSLISSASLSSLSSASFTSSASTSSLPSISSCKVKMNMERCELPKTQPNQVSEAYIIINNNELVECQLKILSLKDPFTSKHTNMVHSINPKHYIRIKVEFKPTAPGTYTDNLLIKIDRYPDIVLKCTLVGRCGN